MCKVLTEFTLLSQSKERLRLFKNKMKRNGKKIELNVKGELLQKTLFLLQTTFLKMKMLGMVSFLVLVWGKACLSIVIKVFIKKTRKSMMFIM